MINYFKKLRFKDYDFDQKVYKTDLVKVRNRI